MPHVNIYFTIFITLCRITITTKGKYTALEAEAIEALLPLVDDDTSEVRLNAIKVTHAPNVQISFTPTIFLLLTDTRRHNCVT